MGRDKFWITDWQGRIHRVTPEKLLERIKSDSSKSNYNWFAPATEIVNTVSNSRFPDDIANELKIIVLKCFAELLLERRYSNERETDQAAVANCYRSVYGRPGEQIKQLYRENLLIYVIEYSEQRPFNVYGKEWHAFCKEWKEDVLRNFSIRIGTDFMMFRANAITAFGKAVKEADRAGKFENDRAEAAKDFKESTLRLMSYMDEHEVTSQQ